MTWPQIYAPLGDVLSSALVASLPVVVLLPAVAAAWVSGLAPALLAAGIDTFDAQLTAEPH